MISNLTAKIKESAVSVIPVMILVVLLNFTIAPLSAGQFPQFLLGGVLPIVGLGVFLLGADPGMAPSCPLLGATRAHPPHPHLSPPASLIRPFPTPLTAPH